MIHRRLPIQSRRSKKVQNGNGKWFSLKRALIIALLVGCTRPRPSLAAQSDWVINTNYPKPGESQPAPAQNQPARYGDYSNMDTDPVGISQTERAAVLAKLQTELAPGTNVVTFNLWSDVVEGLNAVQIVNNVPLGGILFTIVLPPRWTRAEKVPVILSGAGLGDSNNNRLWKAGDTGLVGLVGLSAVSGFKRIIAAYCNSGGAESQGVDEHTYRAVGAFFDFIAQNGGDPQQAITVGGSRGGLTAIMWAANPLELNYRVIATFADMLPTALGSLSLHNVQTYPNLSNLFSTAAHNPDLYRFGTTNGPGHFDLTSLVGVADPTQADVRSPIGVADRLKGKIVVIGRGTHDPYFPLRDFLAFDHRLTELNIAHTTIITLGNGHTSSPYLLDRFAQYVRGLLSNKPELPTPGRYLMINLLPPDGAQIALSAYIKAGAKATPEIGLALPFSAEVPAGAGVGLPVEIGLCGAAGSAYSYRSQGAQGTLWAQGSGTFGPDECAHAEVQAPAQPGDYAWSFSYEGKPIPATNSTRRGPNGCGLPVVTHVTAEQPSPSALLAGTFTLGYGADQFSAQPAACP